MFSRKIRAARYRARVRKRQRVISLIYYYRHRAATSNRSSRVSRSARSSGRSPVQRFPSISVRRRVSQHRRPHFHRFPRGCPLKKKKVSSTVDYPKSFLFIETFGRPIFGFPYVRILLLVSSCPFVPLGRRTRCSRIKSKTQDVRSISFFFPNCRCPGFPFRRVDVTRFSFRRFPFHS